MRILLITDEVWNDRVFGNNVLQNWFEGMNGVDFAQVCATPGKPLNEMCFKYFQLTDMMMLKSLFGFRAGYDFEMSQGEMRDNPQTRSYIAESTFYSFMKRISGTPVRLIRETLWKIGRVNKYKLSKFITDFNPEIVFCPRKISWKLMRIEKIVSKYTTAPFVAFTGDDEASFRVVSYSPLFWVDRFLFHKSFKEHTKLYKHYFMHSIDQAHEYNHDYGVPTSTLFKCGSFDPTFKPKFVNHPIRIVYAGRLYCNRWKTLAEIGNALQVVNKDGVKIVLDIYTQETLNNKQRKALSKEKYIYLKGSATPVELKRIYQAADIALHVESLDKKNRLLTRVSFSTKVIDLMNSTCAIMAICWKEHAGYKYLNDHDAAFCIDSYDRILPQLQKIAKSPELLTIYAQKAYRCGKDNHNRKKIQAQLLNKFEQVIASAK